LCQCVFFGEADDAVELWIAIPEAVEEELRQFHGGGLTVT